MKGLFRSLFGNEQKKERQGDTRMNEFMPSEDPDERQLDADFRKYLLELEALLHDVEDNDSITMAAIKSAYEFYDADWSGILVTDSGSEMWSAARWISRKTGANVETLFDDDEYFENYPLWVNALKTGEAIVIEDVMKLPMISEIESARYAKLEVHGVMGAPYGMRPQGFMVVKNPRRYKSNPDYLKMMAFVGLSSYYQQRLLDELKIMSEEKLGEPIQSDDSVRINIFGIPELVTAAGSINEQRFKSVQGWKLLTYMTLKNHSVPARTIATALWPDEDVESRIETVRNVIYRFRQKISYLETQPILVRDEIGYMFNPKLPICSDVQEFDNLWNKITECNDDTQKYELLKRAMTLYKGAVYAEYADEDWLMIDAHAYETKYVRMTNMVLEILASQMKCHEVCEVARKSLKKVSGNAQAYYWMIMALNHMGAIDSAKTELENYRQLVSEEEYKELFDRLTDASIVRGNCEK